MTAAGLAVAAAGCGTDQDSVTTIDIGGDSVEASDPGPVSIPFCDDRNHDADVEIVDPTPEQLAEFEALNIGAAAQPIVDRYSRDPSWVGFYNDRSAETAVFQFTDHNPEREADIQAMFDHPRLDVVFEVHRYSYTQLDAAQQLVSERAEEHPEMPLTGVGISVDAVVEINLSNLDDANQFAALYDIPKPYDVFCITPDDISVGIP